MAKAPAPKSIQEVLRLFRFYRDETGAEGLIDDVDLTGVLPRQIYHAVHSRPPESLETALADRDHSARDIFAAALRSGEFRENVVRRVLDAYPQKRRLLFIHIPKCAGSNLSANLIGRYASLNTNILDERVTPEESFLRAMRDLILALDESDTIFVHGHVHLQTYEDWGALRFGDEVFTVVRDPVALVVSQINYVLTRIFSTETPPTSDTLGWRREFGVAVSGDPPGPDTIRALASRILRHRGVVPPDVMAHFLGNGRAGSAAERIVTRDIEVTDIARYAAWCRERWQIEGEHRANESRKYIALDDLSAADRDELHDITVEDRRLHRLIAGRLNTSPRPFLIGRELLPIVLDPPVDRHVSGLAGTGFPERDLMLRFESLGENCEFGLVQRRCGAEPLGLLRFSSSPLPKLLNALDARFEGLGAPENLDVQLSATGREYMVLDRKYGLLYHAWVKPGEMTPAEIHAREVQRVPFLVRKLVEDLEAGEKVFVYHAMEEIGPDEARRLAAIVAGYGPSTLMWARLADGRHPPGSIEPLGNGLVAGYVDRFAPGDDAHDLSLPCWIDLCRRMLAEQSPNLPS